MAVLSANRHVYVIYFTTAVKISENQLTSRSSLSMISEGGISACTQSATPRHVCTVTACFSQLSEDSSL